MEKAQIYNKGKIGEELVSNFFDSHFSKFFTFPDPKTKANAQVADVLVWFNWTVFLVEVKARDKGPATIESWVKGKIKEAVQQIRKNYLRIKNNETINLHNSYYQTPLDCLNISDIVGLVILVYDEECKINPSSVLPDIYNLEFPVHVLSWKNLRDMIREIDTVSDFFYYLSDLYKYLKISDIPLDEELNVLGYYKSKSNKFPDSDIDFSSSNYWHEYMTKLAGRILIRNVHNSFSGWIDALEENFSDQRKLYLGYPLGLYFAWELSSISRRERAYFGEKFEMVQDWFKEGHSDRKFAFLNISTGNWLLFYYSKSELAELDKELQRLVELKLCLEIETDSFEYAVYGFGFRVSKDNSPQLLGLSSAIFIGADYMKGKYSKADIEEARLHFGSKDQREEVIIKEFPDLE